MTDSGCLSHAHVARDSQRQTLNTVQPLFSTTLQTTNQAKEPDRRASRGQGVNHWLQKRRGAELFAIKR